MGSLWEINGHLITDAGGTTIIECDACPCGDEECCPLADSFDVTLAGFVDGMICTDCAFLNDTFTLTRTTGCNWEFCTDAWCPGNGTLCIRLSIDEFGDVSLSIKNDLNIICGFIGSLGLPYDCCEILDFPLTLIMPDAFYCDPTDATASISAVCPAFQDDAFQDGVFL